MSARSDAATPKDADGDSAGVRRSDGRSAFSVRRVASAPPAPPRIHRHGRLRERVERGGDGAKRLDAGRRVDGVVGARGGRLPKRVEPSLVLVVVVRREGKPSFSFQVRVSFARGVRVVQSQRVPQPLEPRVERVVVPRRVLVVAQTHRHQAGRAERLQPAVQLLRRDVVLGVVRVAQAEAREGERAQAVRGQAPAQEEPPERSRVARGVALAHRGRHQHRAPRGRELGDLERIHRQDARREPPSGSLARDALGDILRYESRRSSTGEGRRGRRRRFGRRSFVRRVEASRPESRRVGWRRRRRARRRRICATRHRRRARARPSRPRTPGERPSTHLRVSRLRAVQHQQHPRVGHPRRRPASVTSRTRSGAHANPSSGRGFDADRVLVLSITAFGKHGKDPNKERAGKISFASLDVPILF